mgnify:CR=1 FL=1
MVESVLVASTGEYGASIGCRLATKGYKTIFYSPNPSLTENIAKYRLDLYRFISREKFVQILSDGFFKVAREPPDSVDVLIIFSDMLEGGRPVQRETENLVRRLASSTRVAHSIVYSLLCVPGTSSRLHQIFKKYAEESLKEKVFGYAGLLHRENTIHPSYLEDENAVRLLTSCFDELFFVRDLEVAEALTISLLSLDAVHNAVINHVFRIHGVTPPPELYRQVGPDTEDVMRYLKGRERLHGRLVSYAEKYLSNMFDVSCRELVKKVQRISSKRVAKILYLAGDERFGEILRSYLPAKKCRVNVATLGTVYEMLRLRQLVGGEYDLVVLDPWYCYLRGALSDLVGEDKIIVLSGIHPLDVGV